MQVFAYEWKFEYAHLHRTLGCPVATSVVGDKKIIVYFKTDSKIKCYQNPEKVFIAASGTRRRNVDHRVKIVPNNCAAPASEAHSILRKIDGVQVKNCVCVWRWTFSDEIRVNDLPKIHKDFVSRMWVIWERSTLDQKTKHIRYIFLWGGKFYKHQKSNKNSIWNNKLKYFQFCDVTFFSFWDTLYI